MARIVVGATRLCYQSFNNSTGRFHSNVAALSTPFNELRRHRSSATATKEAQSTQTPLPFNELPGAKGIYAIPYLGLLLQMKPFTKYDVDHITDRVQAWQKEYGDIFRMRYNDGWAVYLFHPDDIMAAYRSDGKYPQRVTFELPRAYTTRNGREPGLVELNDEAWFNLRQPAQQKMLRPVAVANYVPILNGVADDFVKVLKKMDKIEDTRMLLMKYATESVGMLCFNKRLGCIETSGSSTKRSYDQMQSELRDLFQMFNDSVFHTVKLYRWFKTPFYRKYEDISNRLFSLFDAEIEEAVKTLESTPESSSDDKEPNLLKDLLLDPRLTKEKTSRVIGDLFFTGIDSSSNSMTFLLYQLAKHPEIQEKLFQEVNSLTLEGKKLDGSVIIKMTYLHACLKESFRVIYPVIFGSTRILDKDRVLGGYQIPKGTLVIACSMFSAIDERNFERPKEYIPERWLRDESGKRNVNPYAILPFGFGPRSCIGQRFAEQEIYIGIAKMIKNFRFKLPHGAEDIQYVYKTFATTEKPLVLHIEER